MKAKALKIEETEFNPTMLTDPQAIAEATAAMEARLEAARTALASRATPANDGRLHARHILADAACRVGDEAITAIVLPTIERVMAGDIQIVDLHAGVDTGLVKAVRSKGLHYRLARLNLSEELIAVALRFNKAFEKARIGKLTASYDVTGGGYREGDQERFVAIIRELADASRGPVSCPLTSDERAVLYGHVIYDVSMCDLGSFVARGVSPDKNMHKFTGKLLLHKALEKLWKFYEDLDWRADQV